MSETRSITGIVKIINETQTFDSGFQKREFVITEPSQYPQDIKLELTKDRCSHLDNIRVGQEVEAFFNIQGNEYNGRYYVNLICWNIRPVGQTATPPPTEKAPF